MRPLIFAALAATLALPGAALAQTQKVKGPSLAGLCASSLEFVAGARAGAGIAQPQELANLQIARDLYLANPRYDAAELAGYAQAWAQRMNRDFSQAADEAQRGAVAQEIGSIAKQCMQQMGRHVQEARAAGRTLPIIPAPAPAQPAPQPLNPQPLPAQPQPVQPMETQPLQTQPLETQPLIINPQ